MSLNSKQVLDIEGEYFLSAATETDLTFHHAAGSLLYDADGVEYVDLACGVLITNIGHAHPRVGDAIVEAVGRSPASYNLPTDLRATLCERLAGLLPGALRRTAMFSSGSEAVDASVRLARQVTGKREVISFRGAFHGRSYLALSVSGKRGLRAGVGDGVPGVVHLPYPDALHDTGEDVWRQSVRETLASVSGGDVAAVLAEPYQGSGGVIVPPSWFLPALRELSDSLGALLIVDEVQSGFGRTGTMFAIEQSPVVPDVVIFGKAMGNGFPIGALTTTDVIAHGARPGAFSSTFGGNLLACAAAHGVLDAFEFDDVLEHGNELAELLRGPLREIEADDGVAAVRQWGLAIGIELAGGESAATTARRVVAAAREEGLVLIPPIGLFANVIRVAPALTMPPALALDGLGRLGRVISDVAKEGST